MNRCVIYYTATGRCGCKKIAVEKESETRMRMLILTCNTGEGHNSCAKAIQETCTARGDVCDILDSLTLISKYISSLVAWGHTTIYRRLPWLSRFGYAYSEKHPALFQENSLVFKLLTKGTEQLHDHIVQGNYDTVVCAHVAPALLLTQMQKTLPAPIHTAFLATDYTCSPIVQQTHLDRYFIPDSSLSNEFVCPNIPAEHITASGIPIRQMFFERSDPSEARAQLGIGPKDSHLVMMCGSMGCGPMKALTKQLSKMLPSSHHLTIVCGSNKRLHTCLQRRYSDCPNIHVEGFVRNMSALMDSADLYLTKPGGLSSTEAAAKALPMVCIDAVAGCEAYNLKFFVTLGGAVTADSVHELAIKCRDLLEDRAERRKMSDALQTRQWGNAAQCICRTMTSLQEAKT